MRYFTATLHVTKSARPHGYLDGGATWEDQTLFFPKKAGIGRGDQEI